MAPIKSMVLTMAGITIVGMPLIAWIIMSFFPEENFFGYMIGTGSLWKHVLWGTVMGIGAAVVASWIIDRPFFREASLKYNQMLGHLKLNMNEIIFISFCAGVGEELLFRGTIQPLVGIIPTSIFFVAIHGYLSFKDWRISIYGLYMTGVIILLGWYTDEFGILAAMIAHTIIDIVLLRKLNRDQAKLVAEEVLGNDEEFENHG